MATPKARQLYTGDINEAVIKVQKATGIEISKSWWDQKVGNNGSAEEILERFDREYEKLVSESK